MAHFLEDHVDIVLRIGDLPDSSLITTRLGTVHRVRYASLAYLASRAAPAIPQDLTDQDVISFDSVSFPPIWRYWSDGIEFAVTIRSRLSVSTIDVAIAAGLAGAGVVRAVSCQIVDHVRDGRLRLLLEAYELPPSSSAPGLRQAEPSAAQAARLCGLLVPQLRNRLVAATFQQRAKPALRGIRRPPSHSTQRGGRVWPILDSPLRRRAEQEADIGLAAA